MRLIIFSLTITFYLISGLLADFLQIEDFDTIEITANANHDHKIIKRGLLDPEQSASESITNTNDLSRGKKISIFCKTARNEDGVCKLFKDCYPMFKLRDGDLTRNQKNNPSVIIPAVEENNYGGTFELEKIYRNVSGPCSKDVLDAISSLNIGKGVPMDEYVCCPKEKAKPPSQPSRPQAPIAPRPEVVGEKKCGTTFVNYLNSPENAALRIINGREAKKHEFPWTVALMNKGAQFCGGSLISESHVLTAAHCIYYMDQKDVSKLKVYLGDHNVYSEKDGPHEERSVSNIYYHRGFSMNTLHDDVAVIRLSKPVNFTKSIQPVCLHTGTPAYDTGTTSADVVGWGQIASKGPISFVLNTVTVKVITNAECVKAYGKKAPAGISQFMICAGGKGRDSCRGDSGGPLTIDSHSEAKQIGIVSWGIGCATYPGVYTRVDKYLSWIYKNQR